MYGTSRAEFPRRIVCLTAETAEIAFLLGAGDRVVGVPGTARRPAAALEKARVGGFTTFKLEKILALQPDLVLAFSDLQRAADQQDELRQVREYSAAWPDRPRVYFEEWMDPLIAGIRWVSEAIEIAGGRDLFAELRDKPAARERIVAPEAVVARDPQIILASWCGKPVDAAQIASRPGWAHITAVKSNQIHEVDGADILSPGPSLVQGVRRIHEIIQGFQASG